MNSLSRFWMTMLLVLVFAVRGLAADAPAKAPSLSTVFHQRSIKLLDQLESDNDIQAAIASANGLFDQAALFAPDDQLDVFREASFTGRLVTQLAQVSDEQRIDTLKYLRKNPELASALVFLLGSDSQSAGGAYEQLNRLREKHANQLNAYANLTAAICVVRSTPLVDHVNENTVDAADAVDVFEFYVAHENKMFFGLKNVPGELLEYVVDVTASVEDLNWAINRYAGDKDIGRHFFDIEYDYSAFLNGTPKEVSVKGFSLPNILKFGGICADQAYFAITIGKATGVPTAYTVGAAGESSHAWVGFLQSNGRIGAWNFNSGRYDAYKGVQGVCRDPQSRQYIPDSYVSLLSELITTKTVDRQNCIALTDVANRLRLAMKGTAALAAQPPADCDAATLRPEARKADSATVLGLAELSLRQSAGYAPSWFLIRDMAVDQQLTLADKRYWSDVLLRLGAQKYPDFTLAILSPMVATIDDVQAQEGVWKALQPMFKTRFDLSASILMSQAAMWEAHHQLDKAGQCYVQVVDRYANDGPFVLAALSGAEKLLIDTGRSGNVLLLYEQTWKKIIPPRDMAQQFATQSNWYRVGQLYAEKLKAAGENAKAQMVLSRIESNTGAAGPVRK